MASQEYGSLHRTLTSITPTENADIKEQNLMVLVLSLHSLGAHPLASK